MKSRAIIAATFCADVSDVERYHRGRSTRAVYTLGEKYFCCAAARPAALDLDWHKVADQFWAQRNDTVLWEAS